MSNRIFLDILKLNSSHLTLLSSGESLTEGENPLDVAGLEGMSLGSALVDCGKEFYRTMQLFQQLVNSNANMVMEYAARLKTEDEKLGK